MQTDALNRLTPPHQREVKGRLPPALELYARCNERTKVLTVVQRAAGGWGWGWGVIECLRSDTHGS